MIGRRDRDGDRFGRPTSFAYDPAGRLLRVRYSAFGGRRGRRKGGTNAAHRGVLGLWICKG